MPTEIEKAMSAGFDRYITKPFQIDEVLGTIADVIHGPGPSKHPEKGVPTSPAPAAIELESAKALSLRCDHRHPPIRRSAVRTLSRHPGPPTRFPGRVFGSRRRPIALRGCQSRRGHRPQDEKPTAEPSARPIWPTWDSAWKIWQREHDLGPTEALMAEIDAEYARVKGAIDRPSSRFCGPDLVDRRSGVKTLVAARGWSAHSPDGRSCLNLAAAWLRHIAGAVA